MPAVRRLPVRVIALHSVSLAPGADVALAVSVVLPFVAVTVQVPSSSTRFGTSAVTVSVADGWSQDAAVTKGVTAVRVPREIEGDGVGTGVAVAVGVPLGTGAGELAVGAGIDGSVTSVDRGDDVTTGDGATCSSEHEVSAIAAATETATTPPARTHAKALCSPTRQESQPIGHESPGERPVPACRTTPVRGCIPRPWVEMRYARPPTGRHGAGRHGRRALRRRPRAARTLGRGACTVNRS